MSTVPEIAALERERALAEVLLLEGAQTHFRLTQALRDARRATGLPTQEVREDRAFVARAATLDDGTGRMRELATTLAYLRQLEFLELP